MYASCSTRTSSGSRCLNVLFLWLSVLSTCIYVNSIRPSFNGLSFLCCLHLFFQITVRERHTPLIFYLLALQTVVNWQTLEVSNVLTPDSRQWFQKLGYEDETIDQFLANPDKRILQKIQSIFDHLNAREQQPTHKIRKWTILPRDFTVQSGELSSYCFAVHCTACYSVAVYCIALYSSGCMRRIMWRWRRDDDDDDD